MTASSKTATLIDHLQEQGYEPQEGRTHDNGDCYDLIVSGTGTVRAVIYPDDENSAAVHLFDRYMALDWSAAFTPGTPGAAVIAVLQAAEWQLAGRRGGPVTPAQAARA